MLPVHRNTIDPAAPISSIRPTHHATTSAASATYMQRLVQVTTQSCREDISTVSFSPFTDTQDLLAYGTKSGLTILLQSRVVDVAFSRQTRRDGDSYHIVIASCAEDDKIRIHTFDETPKTTVLPASHAGPINSIAWVYVDTLKVADDDGTEGTFSDCVASVSDDETLRITSPTKAIEHELYPLSAPGTSVISQAPSTSRNNAASSYLYVCEARGTIRIMHVKTRSWLCSFIVDQGSEYAGLRGLDVYCDEQIFAAATSTRYYLWTALPTTSLQQQTISPSTAVSFTHALHLPLRSGPTKTCIGDHHVAHSARSYLVRFAKTKIGGCRFAMIFDGGVRVCHATSALSKTLSLPPKLKSNFALKTISWHARSNIIVGCCGSELVFWDS
ncbi:hypothetical protein SeMB42_g00256 [Synchytrium endobioticum]|uniref:Uncharacterized protein n=1 Tax=Synchytrium endobioticum TaxID=286115 RepID=A0A507DT57_9FUNG|nr:hypothetical protein SeMB42_g00256 [Synchytrium endobioticum]